MKTVLYDKHVALGAKMVDFAGWSMPVQYQGIIQEHKAVREKAGIFDVSHMGRVDIRGEDAERYLDYLSTNKIAGKKDFSATYTVWCDQTGGAVDDLIVYKLSKEHFFVIVNASNRERDLAHLIKHTEEFKVAIKDRYEDGILAVQGPKAKALVSDVIGETKTLTPMRFLTARFQEEEIVVSETGYTGSGGVEIYAPSPIISKLWDIFLEKGQQIGLQPIGLGARDTLRLEMGFALYGHELSETILPSESVSSWTIKWDKPDFLGKGSLENLQGSPSKRHQYGVILEDKGIAREGYPVFYNDKLIGKVTSGTMSPSLNQAIAIVMVEMNFAQGDAVFIEIRGKKAKGKIVNLPFLSKP